MRSTHKTLSLLAMAGAIMSAPLSDGPVGGYRRKPDVANNNTLTRKAWRKRKRRLELTKASRKANRM